MSTTVIIECISWLINVADNNDARWNPEIKGTQVQHANPGTDHPLCWH